MDELEFGNLIRTIALYSSLVGILAGLDLVCGARVLLSMKRVVDKAFDLDKAIIKFSAAFRKVMDKAVNFDDIVIKGPKVRIIGAVVLILSCLSLLFVLLTR